MPKEAESCLFPTISNFLCYNNLIRPDVVQHRILSYAAIDCHRKVVINITKEKQKTQHERLSPEELEAAIAAAKEQDADAIQRLCAAFTPLILKEAHYPSVWQALGEDAVNTAWVIFLEFIKKYNGCDYRHLPGLIQCHLRYELLHKISRQSSVHKYDSLDEEACQQVADKHDFILELENSSLLTLALHTLTPRQKQVIEAVHLQGLSLQEYCKSQKMSYKTAYLHHKRALAKLKNAI